MIIEHNGKRYIVEFENTTQMVSASEIIISATFVAGKEKKYILSNDLFGGIKCDSTTSGTKAITHF